MKISKAIRAAAAINSSLPRLLRYVMVKTLEALLKLAGAP
ncbi:hypothetical protein J2Y45_005880 [Dyadobacter sp. BE34]|uniref:Uncharacterized protein n=1 Tax=Dyadobacter fermentans TaxID=94254 RepID=A0ABU1R5I8_9BACT|nr:hypothetical protein [Dyadobacter fermentans]MDR7046411.1 hypothetical protein [Dyadobacter sp. BE242]MDR7200724.1 hypothetical protein [Dyadobacter sp. BE34]MDR7218684.1 hypothetical protein [Dyadobacter sp. BE31]MDR7266614.1 hypothetical protein [Dyadobacter sp. BE32]